MISGFLQSFKNRFVASNLLKARFCRKCESTQSDIKYSVIYRFSYITACSAINKYKKLQLLAASIITPASYVSYWFNLCDWDITSAVTATAVASTVAVFSVGQIFTEMIGYVYVDEAKQEIKIAYLDFWGKRKDAIYGLEDFLPLSHSPRYPTDFLFRRIYLYGRRHPYKLSFNFGEIYDMELLNTAFCFDEVDKKHSNNKLQ